MTTLFFADKDFDKVIKRSRSKGYKSLIIDDDVEIAKPVNTTTFTDEYGVSHLRISKAEGPVNDKDVEYMFLVKEIGAVPTEERITDLEIILLDAGCMLVTLKKGAIAVKLENNITIPSLNYNLSNKVTIETIKWVNEEDLVSVAISHNKVDLNTSSNFTYDFIYNMCIRSNPTPTSIGVTYTFFDKIDISLGAFALYKQKELSKAQGIAVRKQMEATMQAMGTDTEYDDYDEDDCDEDDFDDDDMDLGDYL